MKILLIIPCFNEEDRINLDHFKSFMERVSDQHINFLFANDGSKDKTANKIKTYIERYHLQNSWFVFDSQNNYGKANIIYNAYQWSKKNIKDPTIMQNTISVDFNKKESIDSQENIFSKQYDWYGYWDADLATPLNEVQLMIRYRDQFTPRKEVIFGSRILRLGSKIVRKPLRHYLGRIFATLAYLVLKVGSYDSQCGAKLLSRYMAEKAFKEPFLSRWLFDLEIILRVGEANIVEYPLIEWVDMPGSKVQILKEAKRVLKDLFLIRKTYL